MAKREKSDSDKALDGFFYILCFFLLPLLFMWGWNWLGPDFVQGARQIGYGTAFAMTLILRIAA